MSEEIVVDTPVVEETSLPSDEVVNEEVKSGFGLADEDLIEGKFLGKWSNPQEMADYIKKMEDKHSNLSREVSDKAKATDADIEATSKELSHKALQAETVQSIIPDFIANGMVLTEEMNASLLETGLTEQDIKLGAYEFKEAISKNANYVGGQENYNIIMDYHAENMSDEEKVSFNHSIQDTRNSEALMIGLQAMYERSLGTTENVSTDRVRGVPASANTIKAYESKAELLRDKTYADSRVASEADKAKYRARLRVTPENVWRS